MVKHPDKTLFELYPDLERKIDEVREYLRSTGQLDRLKP